MNAVQWQCKLHPSRRARQIHGVLLGGAMAFVIGMPAPDNVFVFKCMLLVLMLAEGWRNDRRLAQRRGWIERESAHGWRWQASSWRLRQPLRWLPGAVLLVGKSERGRTERIWLMQDNMQPAEWRALRACCFSESVTKETLQ